ncbi:RTF domain-containing protein [Pholiota molesta]|nr:RTF domain-containing protein [Pholiota molesta]
MASTPGRSLLSASVASASSLIALQLLSRLTTFALNQALFRLASPTAFGAASIQLDLVLSTILFLSREGVRGALLRAAGDQALGRNGASPSAGGPGNARTANLAFLPVLAGIPLALGTAALFARAAGAELQAQPHFQAAVGMYALAAVGELLSEPLYNVAMSELKVGVRVRAEGLGVTAKSLTTFLVLMYDARAGTGGLALVAFALGQLMYSAVVFGTYLAYLGVGYMRPKLPSPSSSSSKSATLIATYLDPTSLQLSLTLTLQSLVKHFLTEGDKLILSWFSPCAIRRIRHCCQLWLARGAYCFPAHRRDAARLLSRTLGAGTANPHLRQNSNQIPAYTTTQEHDTALIESSAALTQYSYPNLPLPHPPRLRYRISPPPPSAAAPARVPSNERPSVLAAWVWYIPVLAVNGALEAFLRVWMIGFSAIYITAALLLYRAGLGDASLVYANIVNLSARIVYCLRFTIRFFSSSSSVPPPIYTSIYLALGTTFSSLCLASAVSAVLVWASERRLGALGIAAQHGRGALLHPRVIAHSGLGDVGARCLAVWWRTSGRYLGAIPLRRTKVE